jgi:glycosyltransferase involved in cell wall biosynthesis
MRILFLLTQDLESPSGLGRYFPMAKALVQRGNTVIIAALHSDLESIKTRRFQQDGVDVWYVAQMHVQKRNNQKTYYPLLKLLGIAAWGTLRLEWAALTIPADVIVVGKPHPMNSLAGLLGRLHARLIVQDCDDNETGIAHYTGRWQRSVIAYFEKKAPRWADLVTTNTYYTRQRMAEIGVPTDRLHYLSNGVDRERFSTIDPDIVMALRRKFKTENLKVIAFIGSLSSPGHPVELLLRAFHLVYQDLPNTVLLIVGGGDDFDGLQAKAENLEIYHSVRFAGRVKPSEIPAYYAAADVTTDPVYNDEAAKGRSPLKLFESWACGVPFVTNDVGDRRHLLGVPAAGLLAPPGAPEELAQSLLRILTNPALADELRQQGLQRVQEYYWDRLIAHFEAVLQTALHQ